ncbi:uncharacterized protein CLIB1444_01S03576 [[Candida] jaroonii]|uniref:Uncharacterized protein n=1 Tax=[Candida] jaroonii TaxID=467808 RepID=A0ACA9Y058_9ASCO|nr:uncharacterized protein CLIB1444_01S03576 [[Candida] jaroonii]
MKLIGENLQRFRFSNRLFSTDSFLKFNTTIRNDGTNTNEIIHDVVNGDDTKVPGETIPIGSLPLSTRTELLSSIKSLQLYSTNNKKFIDKKRKLFKMMSWRQQQVCMEVGYMDKLNMVDDLINKNQKVLNSVIDYSMKTYQVKFSDFDIIKNFIDGSSFKVIESLSHLNRDWDIEYPELQPILNYIKGGLTKIDCDVNDTDIIVPGSGLGRISHELSKSGYNVDAIELNGLMYLLNNFIYNNPSKNLEIYPYIHNMSNFTTLKSQFRSVMIPTMVKPKNLNIHLEDFKFFEPKKENKTIVLVTAFFMDTAENIIDYIDTINELVKGYENKYWINIGPLKYGSAPQVELNVEELRDVRMKMGWEDIDSYDSLSENVIVGYATDKESLWQGYYGLSGWVSKRS